MIKLLVIDDQQAVRQGLRMSLLLEPDIEIVGEAAGGVAGVELALSARPDVILMDLEMGDLDGISATQILRAALPSVPVIILTMYDSSVARNKAAQAGAVDFLSKYVSIEELVAAIRRASLRRPFVQQNG